MLTPEPPLTAALLVVNVLVNVLLKPRAAGRTASLLPVATANNHYCLSIALAVVDVLLKTRAAECTLKAPAVLFLAAGPADATLPSPQ